MSRSNPTLQNPAQHFFEWKAGEGKLQWYDKEKEKNVLVKLPFEFLVLDELHTVTGYSKQDESGIWANEVRYIKDEPLYVKTRRGPIEDATYSELKQTNRKGGKYAKSIYLAHKIGEEWVIGNFKAHGSAVSAWIEFSKKYHTQDGKIIMTRGKQEEAQTGPFFPPAFEWVRSTAEENEIAIDLDKELQVYLSQYLKTPKDEFNIENIEPESESRDATPEEVSDFERRAEEASKARQNKEAAKNLDVDIEDIDKPVDLSEIPF